jgi:beta-glucosidase-like glycosyl hydrolase
MADRLARLLFPAVRWQGDRYVGEHVEVERALERGVGGFIVFGGDARPLAEWTRDVRSRSREPLLIGADVERGAGQQFRGATALPPLAALGALDDLEVTRRAGELTARESLALGVNWVYAPVADVDLEPRNPIVGTRAFGTDPEAVARHVTAWIEGCRGGGGLSCAKHFPGHGRTVGDSHLELPAVVADQAELEEDLKPFRAAIEAGVDSLMTAHVAYSSLDPSSAPATLSRPIIGDLLRRDLGFGGLVVTDALIMEGVLEEGSGEGVASVKALQAGCDALLYPRDLDEVLAAVRAALPDRLMEARVAEALARIDDAAGRVGGGGAGPAGTESDRHWALEVALRSVTPVRGVVPRLTGPVELVTVDDDAGGPYPPGPRDRFRDALRAGGVQVDEAAEPAGQGELLVALYCDIRGWKGRPGVSQAGRDRIARLMSRHPGARLVLFGHPRLAGQVAARNVVSAWGGEPLMQEAAAAWLLGARPAA